MNRMTRNVAAAALAAAVALGATAPAAVAGPKSGQGKAAQQVGAKSDKAKGPKGAKTRVAKSDRADAQLARKVTRLAERKQAHLARLADAKKVRRLADAEAVTVNLTADVAALEAEVADLGSGADLRAAARTVRSFQPGVYNRITNQLRLAAGLEEALAAAPAAMPEEQAMLTGLVEELLTFTATTPRAELRATQKVIATVKAALELEETPEQETTPTDPEAAFPSPDETGLNT
jgi:hypothetical protein